MVELCEMFLFFFCFLFFFFNDTATTEIYTLSLHDALPIFRPELENFRTKVTERSSFPIDRNILVETLIDQNSGVSLTKASSQNMAQLRKSNCFTVCVAHQTNLDRKSTRLNSSHW